MTLSVPAINRLGFCIAAMIFIFVLVPEVSARQEVKCTDGMAAGFQCENVNLLSIVSPAEMGATETCNSKTPSRRCLMSDIWGWTDPQTNREYAIVGREDGTSFIDVTDPVNPTYVGDLPHNGSGPAWWRDIKVYRDHAFIVADGSAGNGIQILDLTKLREFTGTPISFQMSAHYEGIGRAHNIVINEDSGFAYVVGSSGISCQGLYMLDISLPLNPKFAGCHMELAPVRSYTHDAHCVIYGGPDADYSGREICIMSNENYVAIADVTDKNNVLSISHVNYPAARYVHQGWLAEDHKYFIQNDELDEQLDFDITNTRTLIWDVEDLDDPVLLTEYLAAGTSIDHNLYVLGDYVYQSNYIDGLHILDISDPANPFEVGFFDTYSRTPDSDGYDVWDGTWSNYPYFNSGAIAVSSFEEGLLMVRPAYSSGGDTEKPIPGDQHLLAEAFPNPFTDRLTFTLVVPSTQHVRIAIFDVLGREITMVISRIVDANETNQFEVEISDLSPGTYFYKVTGETFEVTKPITRVN